MDHSFQCDGSCRCHSWSVATYLCNRASFLESALLSGTLVPISWSLNVLLRFQRAKPASCPGLSCSPELGGAGITSKQTCKHRKVKLLLPPAAENSVSGNLFEVKVTWPKPVVISGRCSATSIYLLCPVNLKPPLNLCWHTGVPVKFGPCWGCLNYRVGSTKDRPKSSQASQEGTNRAI